MIVILCESFESARETFNIFLGYLHTLIPCPISKIWKSEYCVQTDDDLRYIFIHWKLEHEFDHMGPDILYEDEFLEGMEELYSMYDVWFDGIPDGGF